MVERSLVFGSEMGVDEVHTRVCPTVCSCSVVRITHTLLNATKEIYLKMDTHP